MASLDGYDANQHEPSKGFEPLPVGDYKVVMVESEKAANKKQTGFFLKTKFQVLDGPFANRILFHYFNLWNPNDKAAAIARGEMSALCRAVGVMVPGDSVKLHNLPLLVSVKIEKRDDNDELANRITAFKSIRSAATTAPAATFGGGVPGPSVPGAVPGTQPNSAPPPWAAAAPRA